MMKAKILICIGIILLLLPVALAQNPGDKKSVIVYLTVENGEISERGSEVVYGPPPRILVEWRDFRVRTLSETGGTLEEFGIEDPRVYRITDIEDRDPTQPSMIIKDKVNFTLVFPFHSNLDSLNIHNYTSDELITSINMKGTISEFCSEYPDDPDCGEKPKPIPINFIMIGILVIVILGALITLAVIFKKRK